ncbi:MAG: hypothetical protein ACPG43_11245, partial [Alcanivoracaceae bacterium]
TWPVMGTLEFERQVAGATYYPSQVFGIGLQLARHSQTFANDPDSFDEEDVRLALSFDPVETFGLLVYYSDRSTEDIGGPGSFRTEVDLDTQTIGAQLDFRF